MYVVYFVTRKLGSSQESKNEVTGEKRAILWQHRHGNLRHKAVFLDFVLERHLLKLRRKKLISRMPTKIQNAAPNLAIGDRNSIKRNTSTSGETMRKRTSRTAR